MACFSGFVAFYRYGITLIPPDLHQKMQTCGAPDATISPQHPRHSGPNAKMYKCSLHFSTSAVPKTPAPQDWMSRVRAAMYGTA
jgi:hypothetical protein